MARSNSLATRKFKSEGLPHRAAGAVWDITIAGPVIVYGTLASVVYGIVLMLW